MGVNLRAMDLQHVIEELCAEKDRLDRVIAVLETMLRAEAGGAGASPDGPPAQKRRGRKSMGHEERKNVSERMRKYWASRRVSRDTENAPDQPK
jgi:hypothetical protein